MSFTNFKFKYKTAINKQNNFIALVCFNLD